MFECEGHFIIRQYHFWQPLLDKTLSTFAHSLNIDCTLFTSGHLSVDQQSDT